MKTCTKCKETKPLAEFSKDKSKKDGLQNSCKACYKAYYASKSDHIKASRRKYYKENPEKFREAQKKYRKANPEKVREADKKYRKANPEKVREAQKRYIRRNSEKISAYHRAWEKANPEKASAIRQRRRARLADAPGSHTAEQWQARLAYFGHKCRYCGSTEELHCDHQIPLSRGGSNWPANLAPACKACNLSKGTKTHAEYLRELSDEK